MSSMNLVKSGAVIWGSIYFLIGVVFSFTLGNHQFWSGAIVYLSLLLLPLPITVMAFWRPRASGLALIVCVAVSVVTSAISAVMSGPLPDFSGLVKFGMFHMPHLAFAAAYFKAGDVIDKIGSDSQIRY